MTDALEEQGMEGLIQHHMKFEVVDEDLAEQLRIYETVLQHEDEGADSALLSDTIRNLRSVHVF